MSLDTWALQATDLGVAYGDFAALDGVSLQVGEGQWYGVIGPNGAGKSSLLGALAGVHRFTGTLVGTNGAALSRRDLALVPQVPVMPEGMTVAEYVLLGRTAHLGWLARESKHDRSIVASVLERLDLRGFGDRLVNTLSGGERQRVAIGRALAHEAPILLLDEPTSALDLGHQDAVLELVDSLRHSAGITIVAAMHDLTAAARFADRLAILNNGRLELEGPPEQVLTAEVLSRVYATPLTVQSLEGELVVLPPPRHPRARDQP